MQNDLSYKNMQKLRHAMIYLIFNPVRTVGRLCGSREILGFARTTKINLREVASAI
jgi:hypothetical protein